jgi:hypothetical protein
MGKARVGVLVVGLLAALPSVAAAQTDATRAAARELGAEGVEAFQAGDFATASDKLGRAFKTVKAPSLGLWSARALVKLGRLVEASERYLEVTRLDASTGDTAVQKQAQQDAAREREELKPRIPSLTLEVTGAGPDVSVTLDGATIPSELLGAKQPSDPGKHVVEAKSGGRVLRREVTLNEGQPLALKLDFTEASADTGAPSSTPAATSSTAPADGAAKPSRPIPAGVWVGVALAGVGAATGGVAALLASSKREDMKCPGDVCPPSERE